MQNVEEEVALAEMSLQQKLSCTLGAPADFNINS